MQPEPFPRDPRHLLHTCTYCGVTPELCEQFQSEAVNEAAKQITPELESKRAEILSRAAHRNECCPNCQHIA